MRQNLERFSDAVMLEFFAKMFGWRDDEVGVVCVVYHKGPHFGLSSGVSEVIVAMDFYAVWNIPRMKPV